MSAAWYGVPSIAVFCATACLRDAGRHVQAELQTLGVHVVGDGLDAALASRSAGTWSRRSPSGRTGRHSVPGCPDTGTRSRRRSRSGSRRPSGRCSPSRRPEPRSSLPRELRRMKLQLLHPSSGLSPRPLSCAPAGGADAIATAIIGTATSVAVRPDSSLLTGFSFQRGGRCGAANWRCQARRRRGRRRPLLGRPPE